MPELHWTAPTDHAAFAGHFPGRPILPGAIILDRVLLSAARWLVVPDAPCRIASAKFLRPVEPGQTLDFRFDGVTHRSVRFQVATAGNVVASGSIEWPDSKP
jgi:3-hydroxyacyl-[acyl-carrier-protein] dehydratase